MTTISVPIYNTFKCSTKHLDTIDWELLQSCLRLHPAPLSYLVICTWTLAYPRSVTRTDLSVNTCVYSTVTYVYNSLPYKKVLIKIILECSTFHTEDVLFYTGAPLIGNSFYG